MFELIQGWSSLRRASRCSAMLLYVTWASGATGRKAGIVGSEDPESYPMRAGTPEDFLRALFGQDLRLSQTSKCPARRFQVIVRPSGHYPSSAHRDPTDQN